MPIPALERRHVTGLEIRDVNGAPRIRGHAAVFNSPSEDLGGFIEIIAPGTFTNALRVDDVRALFNHDSNYVLGRTKAGTLALTEDERGLVDEITPPDAPWARDLVASIRRGDIDGQSFQFRTVRDRWETREGKNFRTLLEVRLYDVGPVTFPAYPETDVQARALVAATGVDDSALAGPALLHALVRAERQLPAAPGDARAIAGAIARLQAVKPAESSQPQARAMSDLDDMLKLVEATL